MKHCIGFTLFILLSTPAFGQKTVKMSAIRANSYGVVYALPKTSIEVKTTYTKTMRKVGEFYQYAERYLSIAASITKDETIYSLNDMAATIKGVVNKNKSYQVEFKVKSTAPYVTLTNDGLICAINDDYTFAAAPTLTKPSIDGSIAPNPRIYLTEEILRAGSTAKQAELIAKQIYRLRESRTDILTGETDNMPPDGEAYKLVINQIDEQEKALMSMFMGTETIETMHHEMVITPTDKDITSRIIFRFSSKLGLLDEKNLAGAPIYLSLINKEPKAPIVLTEKEMKEMDKKFSQGIIFNIPSKASLVITFLGKSYIDSECSIVQFGTQDVLIPKMFEDNKRPVKIIFYPELGSIKQIIQ